MLAQCAKEKTKTLDLLANVLRKQYGKVRLLAFWRYRTKSRKLQNTNSNIIRKKRTQNIIRIWQHNFKRTLEMKGKSELVKRRHSRSLERFWFKEWRNIFLAKSSFEARAKLVRDRFDRRLQAKSFLRFKKLCRRLRRIRYDRAQANNSLCTQMFHTWRRIVLVERNSRQKDILADAFRDFKLQLKGRQSFGKWKEMCGERKSMQITQKVLGSCQDKINLAQGFCRWKSRCLEEKTKRFNESFTTSSESEKELQGKLLNMSAELTQARNKLNSSEESVVQNSIELEHYKNYISTIGHVIGSHQQELDQERMSNSELSASIKEITDLHMEKHKSNLSRQVVMEAENEKRAILIQHLQGQIWKQDRVLLAFKEGVSQAKKLLNDTKFESADTLCEFTTGMLDRLQIMLETFFENHEEQDFVALFSGTEN